MSVSFQLQIPVPHVVAVDVPDHLEHLHNINCGVPLGVLAPTDNKPIQEFQKS